MKAFFSLIITIVIFLSPLSGAIAQPVPMFELSQQTVRGSNRLPALNTNWSVAITINNNGRWQTPERQGQLSRANLLRLRAAVARTRFTSNRPRMICDGFPTRGTRVRAGRSSLVWWSPCGRTTPHNSVQTLIDLATNLTQETPQTTPVTPVTTPNNPPSTPAVLLVHWTRQSLHNPMDSQNRSINTDGSFSANGQTGMLTPSQLATITALVARAQADRSRPRFEPCAALLTGESTISISGMQPISWSEPCGQGNASVQQLLTELIAVTGGIPRLVTPH